MNGSAFLPARIYGILLRRLVPTLDEEYARAAAETFQALAREAWDSGLGAFLRFGVREFRSFCTTVFAEFRARRREKGTTRGEPRRGALASSRSRDGVAGPDASDPEGRGRGHPAGSNPKPAPRDSGGGLMGVGRFLDGLALDVRFAVRNLVRTPGFTVVAVLSLTFGIAVSTVLFSVANAVFIRPLPHAQEPESLVRIFAGYGRPSRLPMSYPEFMDLREATETLADVAVSRDRNFYVGSASEASRRVSGQQVSENYFDVLGISMIRGRGFLKEDIDAGRAVAVIGHNLWQRRFDGDSDVLGQEFLVDGSPYTIIGVGPPGMVDSESPVLLDVVIPTMEERDNRGHLTFTGLARLNDGVSLAQVQAELDAFTLHMAEAYPENWNQRGEAQRGLYVLTRQQAMLPDDSTFWVAVAGFLAVVGLILLITCSNVANLLLTRAHKRRGELAVRSAIGAGSRRILGQLLTENLILFGLAGAMSLFLIQFLASVVNGGWSFLPQAGANFDVDGRVAAFTFGLTLLAGFTFGLLPAKQASRPDLIPILKGHSALIRFKWFGIRNLLVGVQVAGSAVFIVVTLLLLQSLSHVRNLDLGFEPEGVAVLSMNLAHGGYGEEEGRQFLDRLTGRLEGMSGVEGAEVSTRVPLEGGSTLLGGLEPEGYPLEPEERVLVGMTAVSPGYLDLLEVDLLRGRSLLPEDRDGGEMVALASQAFVDRYWPGESGVGKLIRREERAPLRVVGVVEDVPMRSLAEDPSPYLWLPHSQWYDGDVVVHVRSVADLRSLLPTLRRQVAELDPDLPVLRVDLMENITANGTLPQRVLSMILGFAGLVALGLAMLGIYGVVAFSVSQRTREVGLRIALGAEPGRVVRMVLREGIGVALVGLVPGLLLSLAAAQIMRAFLLGSDPLDPMAFAGGLGLLGLSVVAASLAPALRASKAHPMESLRMD